MNKHTAIVELKNRGLNEYYAELDDDITVDIFNLKDKSLSVSAIRSKWLIYLFKERENLKRLKDGKAKNMTILVEAMNKDPEKRSILSKKMEDDINETNPTMKKVTKKLEDTKEIVQFLEMATNILNDFGFTTSNAIKALQLEQV